MTTSQPSELRRYLTGPPGIYTLLGLLLPIAAIVAATTIAAPLWTIPCFLVAILAIGWLCLAGAAGYRPATPAEIAEIRAGNLWHVTSSADVYDEATQTATLDPACCRWLSKMIYRNGLPRPRASAVFVFANRPQPGQLAIHVRRSQRQLLLRLDGADIESAYIGHGRAIALPQGYHGPRSSSHSPRRRRPHE